MESMRKVVMAALCATVIVTALVPCWAAVKSPDSDTSEVRAGESVFQGNCAVCHSIKSGQKLVGPSLYGATGGAHPTTTDAAVRSTVLNGKGRMPGFNGVLSSGDIDNLLVYLKTLGDSKGN